MTLRPQWMTATRHRLEEARRDRDVAHRAALRAEILANAAVVRARENHLTEALTEMFQRGKR